ncbi:hypothetical protein B6N60_00544 [Richelia sinica FACHB-800]|uniref:Uncharacterized protein n=1 Tax=Richelia sinica FACHB-800 TaxID=1357546 RepID=A0A975T5M3_9NOST|nr:hypothetical protein [Richelia sinica]MBD2663015.1 hypothetical protein [Richelia sinica FACHB-800]QXE21866.1 hypothetical protein B6N60_00544 [Richelia sinica FACHB-800]
MNAFEPSRPPLQPLEQPRAVSRPKKHLRQRAYKVLAVETTAKITVNLLVGAAAVSGLVQLLPYHWSQQDKLREIRTEVKVMEARVNNLQTEFSRNFDPSQTKSIMQQQSYRLDPNQRQIVLTNEDQTEKQSASTP